MKKNIQAFVIYLALNLCFFLLMFFSVAVVDLEHKKNVADAAINLTRENFLIGDYRSVSKDIDKIKAGNFHKIEVFGKNNNVITVVSDDVAELSLKFKKSIWVDGNATLLKGYLIFHVGVNHLLFLSLKILLGTVFITGPVFIFVVILLRKRQKVLIENENIKVAEQIARQVSHDIRSPLAALKMALEDSESIPTEQRTIIRSSVQRINDIANNLLNSGKNEKKNSEINIELLGPLVDSLVSEKRMQYRDKIGIQIECDLNNSYGIFAKINSVELKRVLSNLINNAVEAMGSTGTVVVKISKISEEKILLSVSDNGKGMPEHVLKKLGEKGFSHGKIGQESGSGLGFHHAKETIESFGGKLDVESVVGSGTTINISLEKAAGPSWFVENLNLYHDKKILILDDDESMLQVWAGRLPVKPDVFTSGEEFSKAIRALPSQDFLVLIDYELLGQSQNGLELIKSLKIEK